MKALSVIVVLSTIMANTSGCATIIHGRSQDISVASTPPGATVKVDGVQTTTPGSVTLRRDKDYSVVVEKEGYSTQQTKIESKPSWWLLGNILVGGIIGLVIDLAAGGAWTLAPEKVDASLEKK